MQASLLTLAKSIYQHFVGSKITSMCMWLSWLETFSIRFFMGNRKLQFAVKRLQFHVAGIFVKSNYITTCSIIFCQYLFSTNFSYFSQRKTQSTFRTNSAGRCERSFISSRKMLSRESRINSFCSKSYSISRNLSVKKTKNISSRMY